MTSKIDETGNSSGTKKINKASIDRDTAFYMQHC
jgi:hypothetical protein